MGDPTIRSAQRARGKQLNPDEVQGGTFTITNPGQFGGLYGLPIINQPQVAILGIGGIKKRPVVIDDAIAIRSMMYISMSYDHRVVDGAIADQFLAQVKKALVNFDDNVLTWQEPGGDAERANRVELIETEFCCIETLRINSANDTANLCLPRCFQSRRTTKRRFLLALLFRSFAVVQRQALRLKQLESKYCSE